MSEGPSRITGPIPPDPSLCPNYYRRPLSARGRLEGNSLKLDLLPGPIPPESSLYPTCYSARLACPPPRIKPNAMEILERGRKGTVGVLLQLDEMSLCQDLPPKPLREQCSGRQKTDSNITASTLEPADSTSSCQHSAQPAGKVSKDHEKENLRRMREIQRRCREKEQAQELSRPKPVKALWKSQKYDYVESKVKAKLQESPVPPSPEAQSFLRAYSRCGTGIHPRRSPSHAQPKEAANAAAVETKNGRIKSPEEDKKVDFVSHNAQNAKRAQLRRSRSLQSLTEVLEQKRKEQEEYDVKQKGQVPRYLVERKDHWRKEAEERQRNMPDPAMPPGHAKMPESQRLETLNQLKQSQDQLLKDLVLLPVRTDTLSVQNRRAGLEKKLVQIEEALKIFSRPKVFVKLDS